MSREQSSAEMAHTAAHRTVRVLAAGTDEAVAEAEAEGVVECLGEPAPAAALTVAIWRGAHAVIVDDVITARRVVDLVLDVRAAAADST